MKIGSLLSFLFYFILLKIIHSKGIRLLCLSTRSILGSFSPNSKLTFHYNKHKLLLHIFDCNANLLSGKSESMKPMNIREFEYIMKLEKILDPSIYYVQRCNFKKYQKD